ncbi:ATP-binding protein [Desulfogranum mediterraneum]|uniref:ATP-binding protein n=1 Tax=Desulfogranum mediterraneum TaxID=160661 RepID=UPI0003FFCC72|nr:ATP-binding protein [Desulfogranum mediterraneum]
MFQSYRLQVLALLPLLAGMVVTGLLAINMFNRDMDQRLSDIRANLEAQIQDELQARVDTAYTLAYTCREQGFAQQDCLSLLSNIRFDQNNYLWIHHYDSADPEGAVLLVHPNTDILGQDLSGYIDLEWVKKLYYQGKILDKDSVGAQNIKPLEIFKEFNKIASEDRQGFISYYWPKIVQGHSTEIGYPKMSYIRYFEPFHWVLGAGEYADTIDQRVLMTRSQLQAARSTFISLFTLIFMASAILLVAITSSISKKISTNLRQYEQRLLVSAQQLRQSEQRLFDIASSSGDIIWEISPDCSYTFVSGKTENLLGYSEQQLIGTSIFSNIPNRQQHPFRLEIETRLQQRRPIHDLEQSFTTCSGTEIQLLISGKPVLDDSQELIGYRGVYRDITEKKRKEAQQRILEQELQQAQKMEAVGTLAAGIAHEINTPLQFIGDNTSFCQDSTDDLFHFFQAGSVLLGADGMAPEELSEQYQQLREKYEIDYLEEELPKALQESLSGVEQVRTIIQAMKDFSHQGSVEKEEADINQALESTIVLCRNEWKYCAELTTDFSRDLPKVPCYIGELKQVFLNLIVNASHAIREDQKAEGHGRGRIMVRTYSQGGMAIISIQDNGAGIPRAIRDRVFDHFFTTKEVGQGSGQGLAIAYQIIREKHLGSISFESHEGLGTTFVVKLPLQPQMSGTSG